MHAARERHEARKDGRETPCGLRRPGARLLLVAALALSWAPGAAALPFDALVSFGDSLSDVGSGPPEPPDFGGRASNGPLWHEHLAMQMGLEPAETRDFAIGGATSGRDGFLGDETGLLPQVEEYAAAPPALGTRPLFTVWAGGNDALDAAFSGGPLDPEALAAEAAANVATAVETLADAGARDFLVPDLPDASLFPITDDFAGLGEEASVYSEAFNADLEAELATLDASRDLNLHRLGAAELFDAIVADPAAFGLENVSDGCTALLNNEDPCEDPDAYLFWDPVHPTTAVHGLLGARGLQAVPEPGTGLLVAAGIALVGVARRRR